MILSEEEVDARLNSPDNLINRVEIRPYRDRQDTSPRVPELVQRLLGSIAANREDETLESIGETFNVDKGSISRYSRGLVGERHDTRLDKIVTDSSEKSIKERKESAHNLALDGLMDTLELLKPSLAKHGEDLKPSTIAKVASDMAKISKNLTPENEGDKNNNTVVILFKPEQKHEAHYETIDV